MRRSAAPAAAQTEQDRTLTVAILPFANDGRRPCPRSTQWPLGSGAPGSGTSARADYLDISQGNGVTSPPMTRSAALPASVTGSQAGTDSRSRQRCPVDLFPRLLAGSRSPRHRHHRLATRVIAAGRSGFVNRRLRHGACWRPCFVFRVTPMSAVAVARLRGLSPRTADRPGGSLCRS